VCFFPFSYKNDKVQLYFPPFYSPSFVFLDKHIDLKKSMVCHQKSKSALRALLGIISGRWDLNPRPSPWPPTFFISIFTISLELILSKIPEKIHQCSAPPPTADLSAEALAKEDDGGLPRRKIFSTSFNFARAVFFF